MKRVFFYAGFFFVVAVLGLSVIWIILNSPDNTGYSEVYFEKDINGSISVKPNITRTITFYIQSHESSRVSYSYVVYLGNVSISHGNVSLEPGEIIAVPVDITVKNISYSKIVVNKTVRTIIARNSTGIGIILCKYGGKICKYFNVSDYPLWEDNVLLFNGSSSFHISDIEKIPTHSGFVVIKKEYSFVKLSKSVYILNITVAKEKLYPIPLMLRIVIHSSTGKCYKLLAIMEVEKT